MTDTPEQQAARRLDIEVAYVADCLDSGRCVVVEPSRDNTFHDITPLTPDQAHAVAHVLETRPK
jgi:hypothetical protein